MYNSFNLTNKIDNLDDLEHQDYRKPGLSALGKHLVLRYRALGYGLRPIISAEQMKLKRDSDPPLQYRHSSRLKSHHPQSDHNASWLHHRFSFLAIPEVYRLRHGISPPLPSMHSKSFH